MLRFLVRFSLMLVLGFCAVIEVITSQPPPATPSPQQQREGASFHEVLRYGRGMPSSVHWQPDGDIILVNSISGVWLYTDTLTDLHHFPDLRDAWFSPDGRWIIGKEDERSASAIYDAASFQQLALFEDFYYFTFSPDNRYISYADTEEGVVVLETTGLTPVPLVPQLETATGIRWSANAKFLSVVYPNQIEVWDVEQRRLKYTLPHTKESYPHLSPDGSRLLIDHPDNTLELREGKTGELIKIIPADERFPSELPITNPYMESYFDLIVWKPDSTEFLRYYPSNGAGAIQVYSPDGEQLHDVPGGEIFNVSFTKDGQYLASSAGIFETQTYTRIGDFYAFNVSRSPDERFVSGISMFSDALLFELQSRQSQSLNMHGKTYRIVWSPTGDRFITAGTGMIELVDTATQKVLYQHEGHIQLQAGRFNSTGDMIAVSDDSGTLRVWDTKMGILLATLSGSNFSLIYWEWQPGGELLAMSNGLLSGERPPDGNVIYVWNARTAQLLHKVTHHGTVTSIAWSPDGKMLASGSAYLGNVLVSDPYTHHRLVRKDFNSYHPDVFWNTDGKILVLRDNNGLPRYAFWDRTTNRAASGAVYVESGIPVWNKAQNRLLIAQSGWCEGRPMPRCDVNLKTLSTFPVSDTPAEHYEIPVDLKIAGFNADPQVAWNKDGNLLLIQAQDYLEVWDIEEKRKLWLTYHVAYAQWSADGVHLLIQYKDQRVRILNVTTGETLHLFADVDSAAWLEDGETIMLRRGEDHQDYDYQYYNGMTGERRTDFPNLPVKMSADGNTLVHLQDGIMTLWSRE